MSRLQKIIQSDYGAQLEEIIFLLWAIILILLIIAKFPNWLIALVGMNTFINAITMIIVATAKVFSTD